MKPSKTSKILLFYLYSIPFSLRSEASGPLS